MLVTVDCHAKAITADKPSHAPIGDGTTQNHLLDSPVAFVKAFGSVY